MLIEHVPHHWIATNNVPPGKELGITGFHNMCLCKVFNFDQIFIGIKNEELFNDFGQYSTKPG